MGLFSRSKKPPPPAAETPPDADQDTPPDQAAKDAQPPTFGGYGSPVEVSYGQMKLHAEKPDWKFVPRPPADERSAWRPWRRSARAVERPAETKPLAVTVMPPRRRRRWNYGLALIALGFLALSMAIQVWNARSPNGDWFDMAIPVAMGVLPELAMFFLPLTVMVIRNWLLKGLAVVFLIGFFAYALTNSLRTASILSNDQATARADRQTTGVQTANKALTDARASSAAACRAGQGKSQACKDAQAAVKKEEAKQSKAATTVATTARPENADFSALVSWITRGAIVPGANDFAMLWLLFRTIIPQCGGFLLMLARR
jgi:hypothetical protein